MPTDGARLVEAYRKVDDLLVAKGAVRTSDTLRSALEDFWTSNVLRMVVRKGRQIGWSTTVTPRVIVTTILAGVFTQARGSRGTIAHFSTRQKEADERLYNDERVLFDVGIKCKVRGETIELAGLPVIIQSFPATSDVARGTNLWIAFEDEMPVWRDSDGANPAAERDAAIVPAGVSHENFRLYSAGTPMGTIDFHAKLVDRGDTDSQRVYVGPSWYWRPDLTEKRCRQLQPDPRLFAREFGALPQNDDLVAVDVTALKACVRSVAGTRVATPIAFIDTSGGKGDAIAWMVAAWHTEAGRRVLYIYGAGALEGSAVSQGWSVENVARHIATCVNSLGAKTIVGDQFGAWGWSGAFGRQGLTFLERPWTNESKTDAVIRLRQILRESSLAIEPGAEADALLREAVNFREKIQPSGAITFAASRGHDDRMMTLLLAARVDAEGGLSGSTLGSAAMSLEQAALLNEQLGSTVSGPVDFLRGAGRRSIGGYAAPQVAVRGRPRGGWR